jgi:hypothetical protein
MSRKRSFFLSIVATALVFILLEGFLSWGYAIKKTWERSQPRQAEAGHSEHDSELGWVNRASVKVRNLYGQGRHFTTNRQRFRGSEDYSSAVPEGRVRTIFLGDSFTMGFGVDDSQTYPSLVEAMDPAFQSVNMGMGAYGIGQSYLWYRRDGAALDTHLVVFAFIAHDFARMTLEHYISPKPRLSLLNDELIVQNVPVPTSSPLVHLRKAAREFTYWLDIAKLMRLAIGSFSPAKSRLEESREAVTGHNFSFAPVGERIFKELAEICRKREQQLFLVYLPTKSDVGRARPVAEWVHQVAMKHRIPFVDLTPEFEHLQSPERWDMFLPDGHYSPAGNRLVANALIPWLRDLSEFSKWKPTIPDNAQPD